MDGSETHADGQNSLDPQDAALFDRLVEVQFDVTALTDLDDSTRQRAERLVAILGLLDQYPVEPLSTDQRETLISATLARINREDDQQRERMQFESSSRLPRLRIRELVAIAAVIIVGLALVFPMMRTTSQMEGVTGSQANLAGIYRALGQFESEHDGQAPSAVADDAAYQQVLGYSPTTLDMEQLKSYGVTPKLLVNPMRPEALSNGFSFHSQRKPRIIRFGSNNQMVIISGQNLHLGDILKGQTAQTDTSLKTVVLRRNGHTDLICPAEKADHIWDCDQHRIHGPSVEEIFLIHGQTRPSQPEAGQQAP